MTNLSYLFQKLKGGAGSGNWGHAGRPGEKGGSAPRSFAMSLRTGRDWQERQRAKVEALKPDLKKATFELPVNKETEAIAEAHVIEQMHGRENAEKALKQLESLLQDAPVSVRVPGDILAKILDDGRFKNQHETGTSKGMLKPDYRKQAEQNAFGNHLEKPSELPFYGYMSTGKNGYRPFTMGYGNIKIEFTPEVKARTTVTAGDSLRPFADKEAVGTPANKPRLASLDNSEFNTWTQRLDISSYVEAQIHGPLTTKDIAKVIIPKQTGYSFKPSEKEEVVEALKKHNIPYEEVDDEGWLGD